MPLTTVQICHYMRCIGTANNGTALPHFGQSPACTIGLKAVFTMGEEKAHETFRAMRWPETDGEAVCPRCGCVETYDIARHRKFKCVACHHQFSVTSGTIFSSRKMSFTDLLAAIVIFLNGAKTGQPPFPGTVDLVQAARPPVASQSPLPGL